jgi:hypothetical protein
MKPVMAPVRIPSMNIDNGSMVVLFRGVPVVLDDGV